MTASGKMTDPARRRAAVREATAAGLDGWFALARALYDDPELSGEETRAARRLIETLEAAGFTARSRFGELPTAFVAEAGKGRPIVGLLAEYDALPGVGHGCGHNLIAATAVGAATVARRLLGTEAGTIRVIGTPAEETWGGKAVLAAAGCFDDLDAALIAHPGFEDRVLTASLACQSLEVTYHGRAAHAVVHPDRGANALDALLALFAAREGVVRAAPPGSRIVGVVREGGERPNIVPERAVGAFSLRATDRDRLVALRGAFEAMAAALGPAWGCACEIRRTEPPYDEMRTNTPLAAAWRDNLEALGRAVNDAPRERMGSLDMGNVSRRAPSVHAFFALAPPEVASHTRDFAAATVLPAGRAALEWSIAGMAMTALDVCLTPGLADRARREHQAPEPAR